MVFNIEYSELGLPREDTLWDSDPLLCTLLSQGCCVLWRSYVYAKLAHPTLEIAQNQIFRVEKNEYSVATLKSNIMC